LFGIEAAHRLEVGDFALPLDQQDGAGDFPLGDPEVEHVTPTFTSLNAGMYLRRGSVSASLPCSNSIMAVTVVIGLVSKPRHVVRCTRSGGSARE
jgi:hypothetical protein